MVLIIKEPHKQVIAKTNSYVDERIKELIELLNTFDNVQTFESCQGKGNDSAFIMLSYGLDNEHSFDRTMPFVKKLVASISRVIKESGRGYLGDGGCKLYELRISIDWDGDMKYPYINIYIHPDDIEEVTKEFYKVKEIFDSEL